MSRFPRTTTTRMILALLSSLALMTVSTAASGQRARGTSAGVSHDSTTEGAMPLLHALVMHHDRVTRTVTNLPNGVRAVTESSDPALARRLKVNVASLGAAMKKGHDGSLPLESAALRTLRRNRHTIVTHADTTPSGVVIVQTSSDSATAAALQAHAAELSRLIREGMPALHRGMSASPAHEGITHGDMEHGGMDHAGMNHGGGDSAFAALQARGASPRAMGVDQYTSIHRFDVLPDGARIELQRAVDDAAGVAQIRKHLGEIAAAFGKGDFSIPAEVHARVVPGTSVMAAKRSAIRYVQHDLPRGGEVRITTRDPEALAAIREFIAFQRQDHHAGGTGMTRRAPE